MRKKIQIKLEDKEEKNVAMINAQELYKLANSHKYVKSVTNEVSINNKKVQISDIMVKMKGPGEDTIFASSKLIHLNVRRGVTVIKWNEDNNTQYSYLRRGLQKFFDVQSFIFFFYQSFSYYEDFQLQDEKLKKQNLEKYKLRCYSLEEVEKALLEGREITICKMEKANGENAQISYFKPLKAWVICSKNVSMLATNKESLKHLSKEKRQFIQKDLQIIRFSFATLIADVWFRYLNQYTEEDRLKLQDFLSEHTLVGEYCGNPLYQHLVGYNEIQLRFYALVNHNSQYTCIDPLKTRELFEQFKLNAVKFIQFKSNDLMDFYQKMKHLYQEISVSSIEEEGEGAVVYFSDSETGQCYSLAKLKTLECKKYQMFQKKFLDRLFRKLREKLKSFLKVVDLSKADSILKKYKREVEELCQNFQPKEHPLQYYFDLAEFAFRYIIQQDIKFTKSFNRYRIAQKNKKDYNFKVESNLLSSHFLDFLQQIRKGFEENNINKDILPKMMDQFGNEPLEDEEEEQEGEQIEQQEEQKQQLEQNPIEKPKQVIALFPQTLPGSGQTTFLNHIKKNFKTFKYFSLYVMNQVRKKGKMKMKILKSTIQFIHKMKQIKNTTNDQDRKQLRKKSRRQRKMMEEIRNLKLKSKDYVILQIPLTESTSKYVIILFDKYFFPDEIKKTFLDLKGKIIDQLKIGIIRPKCGSTLTNQYSVTYLVSCLGRQLSQKNENISEEEITQNLLKYYRVYMIQKV